MSTIKQSQIELMVGPYRSGKTLNLLSQLLAYLKDMQMATIIVPSARYRKLLEKRLFDLLKENNKSQTGYFGLQIITLEQICKQVLRANSVHLPILSKRTRNTFLNNVLNELVAAKKLPTLESIAYFKGTNLAIIDLIDEFEKAGLTPEDVLARLKKQAASESRYIELASIYEAYWQKLKNDGLADQHMLFFKARELLANSVLQNHLSNDLLPNWLLIDGFDRFNKLQLQIISDLSRRVQRTTITFDYLDEHDADNQSHEYAWKTACYKDLIDILRPKIIESNVEKNTRKDAETEVFKAPDQYLEMEEIARRIKYLIVHKNIRTENILVIVRSLNGYRAAIDIACKRAGIPYFVDESINIAQLPIVQFIKNLLTLTSHEFKREQVISCLRSAYFNLATLEILPEDINWLDTLSLKAGLISGALKWESLVLAKTHDYIKTSIKKFFQLVSTEPKPKSMLEHCISFENILDKFLLKPDKLIKEHDESTVDAYKSNLALAKVRSVIANLIEEEKLLGQQQISYETFVSRFISEIDQANFRTQPDAIPCITVCGAEYAPNCSFDIVFIGGLFEGGFPAQIRSSGFVSLDELARWTSFGVGLYNSRHHPAFEKALFYSLLGRAQEKIYLSYPGCDMHSGNELTPSFFITNGDEVKADLISVVHPYVESATAPVSADNAFASWLWTGNSQLFSAAQTKSLDIKNLWQEIETPMMVSKLRGSTNRANLYNGYLSELVNMGALSVKLPEKWSVSRLNDYGQCPFRFWVSHILSCKKFEEPEVGLNVKLKGEIYHKALELFYKSINDTLGSLTNDEVQKQVLNLALKETFDWLSLRTNFQPGPFFDYEKLEIKFRLERFIENECKRLLEDPMHFTPSQFEVKFGMDSEDSYPPLVIKNNNKEILLRGIIDRVDTNEMHMAQVVDYKSGTSRISPEEARKGRNLQLPLYTLAVENAVMPGTKVAKAHYLSVGSGESIGKLVFIDNKDSDLLSLSKEQVIKFRDAAAAGDFTVSPNGNNVCQFCDHATICRVDELVFDVDLNDDEQ